MMQRKPRCDAGLSTGFEELTARLESRLEELRRETGDNYVYKPCRTSVLLAQYGPPERPEP